MIYCIFMQSRLGMVCVRPAAFRLYSSALFPRPCVVFRKSLNFWVFLMERLLEFVMNHPELVVPFVVLLVLLIMLESRRGGKTVSSQQLTNLVNKEGAVVVDVRESKEYREGHITESRNIPFASLKENLAQLEKFKDKPVILVCKMGQHAGAAGRILSTSGFKDVRRLSGGITTWKSDGLPLVKGK